jgi:hypothetical protein
MKLAQMEDELYRIIRSSDLRPFLAAWINTAILEIATEFELATLKLVDPEPVTVDTSQWLWPLPADFHKKLFRAEWFDGDGHPRHIRVRSHIDYLSGRDHNRIAEHVHEVAETIEGQNHLLGVYPKASQILYLWYYRLPAVLKKGDDQCDCIPHSLQHRVIYPRVIIRNYPILVDQVVDFPISAGPLQYWETQKERADLDLKNFLAKVYNKPRRHGGRDPIGPTRRWFRGYF